MLNALQQEAYDSVLHGDNRITILSGEGGSGKTYCAAEIAKDFPGSVLITATTNKAASVLRESTGMDARTIQSRMGYVMKQVGYDRKLVQEREPEVADLIIVDEISMLPQPVYSTLINSGAKKILFLGDPVQLPSVGTGVDIDSIPGKHIELTEQMRQTTADPLTVRYLSELRYAIDNNTSYPKIPTNSPDIVIVEGFSEFADIYNNTSGTKKIVAYRNGCVNSYNRHISGGSNLFNPGEQVVINAPVGDNRNGDILMVVDAVEYDGHYGVELSNGEEVIHWKSQSFKDKVLDPLKESRQWRQYWNIANRSVDLKHLFACTAHKAQGSTYDTVFIDGTDITNAAVPSMYGHTITIDLMMRLGYVAMSRIKAKVIIFNGESRNYNKLKAVK